MMLQRDRVFLQDYYNFSGMNHLVTAQALFMAGVNAGDIAALVTAQLMELSMPDADKQAQELNEAGRVQKIMAARLYAEMAASLEDLGALCDAVRHRAKEGIFKRYLRSQSGAIGTVYDDVLSNNGMDLAGLLNLPTLAELQSILPSDVYPDIAFNYANLSTYLVTAATNYRDFPSGVEEIAIPAQPHPEWKEDVNIVVDLWDHSEPIQLGKGGLLPQTYNKIKHRFMVIENLEGILQAFDTPGHVLLGMLSTEEQTAHNLMRAVRNAVVVGQELAALLIILDQHGIAL